MNNKISIRKFWQAGGLCEIELYPEIAYITGEYFCLYANSAKSFREAWRKLELIRCELEYKTKHKFENEEVLIRNVRFSINGISYKCEDNFPRSVFWETDNVMGWNYYLVATGKYYRGSTL